MLLSLWLGAVLLTVGGSSVVMAEPASATTSHCLIINNAINASYGSLAAAQAQASPGATLWVRGICGGDTELMENVSLVGQHPKGFLAPTLEGTGSGSVLTVDPGVTVNLTGITISGGTGTLIYGLTWGGGIYDNAGTVNMTGGSVTGNTATEGGGIWNFNCIVHTYPQPGLVDLSGGIIANNTAQKGGGIFNFCNPPLGGGAVDMTGGSVTGNTATEGGGIWNGVEDASFNLSGGSIIDNTAEGGGGIFNSGYVSVSGGTIAGNMATVDGGGIYIPRLPIYYRSSSVSMSGGSITGNTAADNGGGIFTLGGGYQPVSISGGSVTGNTATDGGGIYSDDPFVILSGGSVAGNSATVDGGGIFNNVDGTVYLSGGSITGNTATVDGGGIFNLGTLVGSATTITGNTPNDES
jgi:predicted outer membrane repeat protein